MSKYASLRRYLAGVPINTTELTLTFEQIERILTDHLPLSATRYRQWWANEVKGSHVQANSWMDAGWIVDTVSLQSAWVQFRRK